MFVARVSIDSFAGKPWDNCEMLGSVRESRWPHKADRSDKSPGERPLNRAGRHETQFYYDFAAAVDRARREGCDDPAGAAEQEYAWLRGWMDDDWTYVSITLHDGRGLLLDSLGCVECAAGDEPANDPYVVQTVREMVLEAGGSEWDAERVRFDYGY